MFLNEPNSWRNSRKLENNQNTMTMSKIDNPKHPPTSINKDKT